MSWSERKHIKPLRLLIAGAGAVVTEYYIPALLELGWERSALIVDRSFEALRRAKWAAPEADVTQVDIRHTLENMARGGSFDACVIALPNQLHPEATRLALMQGLHVLCEKPLALSREACEELADVAQRAQRVLSVGMVRRLLPSFGILRHALRQNLIGELTEIDVEDGEPYAWSSDSGAAFQVANGGVLADMGVHYLDLIEEIGGGAHPVSYSDDYRGGVEANVDYALRTRGDVPCRMRLSRTRRLRNTFVCRGQHGELVVEKDRFDGCWWRSGRNGQATWLQPHTRRMATLETCFAEQLLDFARSIRSGGAPAVSADRAASTVGLIQWAYCQRDTRRPAGADATSTRSNGAAVTGEQVTGCTDAHKATATAREAVTLPSGRVCITGATGFIGTHLVERLGETGLHDLVAPVRGYRKCAQIARFPVSMPRCDLLDFSDVRKVVSGARFVFHLAYGRDGSQPERVTIEGTRNVVDAAIETGAEAVVVLSTIYVFGQTAGEVDESGPYHPVGGAYGTSKALMERWCLGRAQSSPRTRLVVLCPSCVYGPGGDAYSALPARLARNGGFCWIEDGRGAANYTYVENLLDAMLLGAVSAEADGRRFIVNDGATTWRKFLSQLLGPASAQLLSYTRSQLRELHRQRHRPSLLDVARIAMADPGVRTTLRDSRIGEAVLWGAEHATPAVMARMRRGWHSADNQHAPVTQHQVTTETHPPEWLPDLFGPAQTVFRSDTARQVLGWSPQVSLEDGMQATRTWIEANV
jgi:predicted dehydrogenase/nucleoside-diphosphate-sugar epimerase